MKKFEYTGQVSEDLKMHGIGRSVDLTSGNIYEGEFVNGVQQGFGRLIYGNSKTEEKFYIGNFQAGLREGEGELGFKNGVTQIGDFEINEF